jgi:hypothetical protein
LKKRALAALAVVGLSLSLLVRSLLRVPFFETGSGSVTPRLLQTLPDLRVVVSVLLAGVVMAILVSRKAGLRDICLCFAPASLALVVFLPGVFAIAPFTASVSGRLLDVLLAACLLAALWRFLERSPLSFATGPGLVAAAAFVVYLLVGWKMGHDVGLSGDEPHYLLITESLLRDGDLAVANNYQQGHYASFYRGKIGPHLAAGTPYSIHGIGLPLVLLPGYALLGLTGVLLTEALLSAILVHGMYRIARSCLTSTDAGVLAVLVFGCTAPGLFLAVSAYPELPAAVVVVLVVARVVTHRLEAPGPVFGWAILVGTLPFFHMKFVPLALVLWGALAYRSGRRGRVALASAVVVSALAVAGFFYWTSGSFDPTASYGRQRIFLDRIPTGLLGLLFDQEFGLLIASPVYLLGLFGLVALVRRHRFLGIVTAASLAAVALPGAAHPLWSGGNSPPARFLFPALPLLAVSVVTYVGTAGARSRLRGWSRSLFAWSVAVGAAMLLLPGQPLYLNARDGTGRVWEALSSSWDVAAYLPSVVRGDPRSLTWAAVAGASVVAVLVMEWLGRRVRVPSFVTFVLLFAWIQDLSGVSIDERLEGRWASSFLLDAESLRDSRFLSLPGEESLGLDEALERVTLPIEAEPLDGDRRHWRSRRYRLPAGELAVVGVGREGLALCNGGGCFEEGHSRFVSRVGLAQFHLRAAELLGPVRIRLLRPLPNPAEALQTLGLPDGARLHALDDEVYLDPSGFWVKGASRARFILESPAGCEGGCGIELEGGGIDNWVTVVTDEGSDRFLLRAHEKKIVRIPGDRELSNLEIASEGSFRPSDLDGQSRDHRALGVLVRPFDLSR